MKKILPIFFLLLFSFCFVIPTPTLAASPSPTPSSIGSPSDWVTDKEVTTTGKGAARAGELLDWALADYRWSTVDRGQSNPLLTFWVTMRNIVYSLLILFVIATAFVLIVTRGRSLSAKRFVPRFIMIVLLVTFSFSLLQFLYQIVDAIQGFFLRSGAGICPPACISQKDLIFVGWDYTNFIGYRRVGDIFNESANISLFLTKLTTITYNVMVGILLIRKIILWFFIILSPIFPLLLLYYPVRNTAKIWVGEFFRWLMYAPLFAILLSGLVSLWRVGIPLQFNNFQGAGEKIVYPTAVSILLGGPQQAVNAANNINLRETYALYIVSLIMLWIVIILPFVLLQTFLDLLNKFSFSDSNLFKYMMNYFPYRHSGGPPPLTPLPPDTRNGGLAKALKFSKDIVIPEIDSKPVGTFKTPVVQSTDVPQPAFVSRPTTAQAKILPQEEAVLKLTSLPLPTMRDIAKYETAALSKNQTNTEYTRVNDILRNIANPASISSSSMRENYSTITKQLMQSSQAGNRVASNILTAAKVTNTTQTQSLQQLITKLSDSTTTDRQLVDLRERVRQESMTGNPLATKISQYVTPSSAGTQNIQTVIEKIANESLATSSTERQEIAILKQSIQNASVQNDELARQLLAAIKSIQNHTEVTTSLTAVVNPKIVSDPKMREQYANVRNRLTQEKSNGNPLATNVLGTLQTFSSATSTTEKAQAIEKINKLVSEEKQKGNPLASYLATSVKGVNFTTKDITIPETLMPELKKAQEQGSSLAAKLLALASEKATITDRDLVEIQQLIAEAKAKNDPLANLLSQMLAMQATPKATLGKRVQSVSLEDYEALKKLWVENYRTLDVPSSIDDTHEKTREEWIQDDIDRITKTINLLLSPNQEDNEAGMDSLSSILPFLLIGGFSKEEIQAYLKAKLEAAKNVLEDLHREKTKNEDTMLLRDKPQEQPKEMHAEASRELPEKADN
jgi:hypothetical protein